MDGTDIIKGVLAWKAVDHFVTSADARLYAQSNDKNISYLMDRDDKYQSISEKSLEAQLRAQSDNKYINEQQIKFAANEAYENRKHEAYMQSRELEIREKEIYAQEKSDENQRYIAELGIKASLRNADLDREARLRMHAQELDLTEQLELRRLRVQEQINAQQEQLQKYLLEQGKKNSQELEYFKALAMRETQILLARENAQNILQDHMVQEALKNFPLNISPIVLLRNRPHSLKGLLRFSSNLKDCVIPDVTQVYEDVKRYAENPEAINVFIAPIHVDSKIKHKENISLQIWDTIYQKVESFFTERFNRRGKHPVIFYPTAWKDKTVAGQHASETLHFFLKNMPCIVIEPRFDGYSLSLMLSCWNLGYISTDHVRFELKFDINLDLQLIKSAYQRSRSALNLINKLNIDDETINSKKKEFEANVNFYDQLGLNGDISEETLSEIEAMGVYNIFKIDPTVDLKGITDDISSLIGINIALLADIHHLFSTDTVPLLPEIFKDVFPSNFQDRNLRELISQCYERVYISLRKSDTESVNIENRRELEKVRELQITNMQKLLELIDKEDIKNTIVGQLRQYISDKYGETSTGTDDELWIYAVDKMAVDDIPFFKEILPNIEDRRLYKRIDKKIAELQRT